MKFHRIMIAATKSGSGKTTVTIALLQALKCMGEQVVSYKCGPDYIDPMFHQTVIGIPSKNLDTFFTGEEETRRLMVQERKEGELAVVEGVMGLYDGLGGIREEGSSYHLAQVTKTPIILVVDAKGMGRSLIAEIAGFLDYDSRHLIAGVLLNRMSGMYYETMKPLIEKELPVKVIGYVPDFKEFSIGSRHLGLVMPDEISNLQEQIRKISEKLKETVDFGLLLEIAGTAKELTVDGYCGVSKPVLPDNTTRIAVARDEAFCFYYRDNIRMLEEYGAKLVPFSPLHDEEIPDGCCGILLGGGYPELYAKELSENARMRNAIAQAVQNHMPVVAECGGFMYLHEAMRNMSGTTYPMAGVIPAECHDTGKLVRFGYVEVKEKRSNFLPEGEVIRGHEFHYYDSDYNGTDCVAVKPVTGREYSCVIDRENLWLGFTHLYYPSNPSFARRFVEKADAYHKI